MRIHTSFICLCLLASLISGVAVARLLPDGPYVEMTPLQQLIKSFSGSAATKVDIQTVCSVVELAAHNGVTRSGYLNVGVKGSKSALGFIFYGATGIAAEQLKHVPTIIWLNGGPGCSSQFGNFYELGPLYVNQTLTGDFVFTPNTHGWTNKYNTIFVDQPVGAGISYAENTADIPTNQSEVATQFVHALSELYNSPNGCFNQLGLSAAVTPLFIFGESYAGKYVPQIGARIAEEGNKYNLKGIGIGDGFTVPYYVVGGLSDFAYSHSMTTPAQYIHGKKVAKQTQDSIDNKQFKLAQTLFNQDMQINNPHNIDVYNVHRKEEPDSTALPNLLNSKFGQQLFHLTPSKTFAECDQTVYAKFSSDFMNGDSIKKVEYLLQHNYFVEIFNGDLDFIVPYTGTEVWIELIEWQNKEEFNNSPTFLWTEGEAIYGTVKSFGNLLYRRVFNSGHMVPQDQPAAALDLITKAITRALAVNTPASNSI